MAFLLLLGDLIYRQTTVENYQTRGDRTFVVNGLQAFQQLPGLAQSGGRRRGQPGKPFRMVFPPCGNVQHHGGEVCVQDFGSPVGGHPGLRSHAPEPVAGPGSDASGASGALVGHIPADADGVKVAQAAAGIVNRPAAQPCIHDDPDAFDGKGRLCDRGGQDDPPLSWTAGREGLLLFRVG